MTTLVAGVLAAIFCALLMVCSYVGRLYMELMRFHPRGQMRALEHFDKEIESRLRLKPEEGWRRFRLARHLLLIGLTLALAIFASRNEEPYLVLLETIVLAVASLMLFAHAVPSFLLGHSRGTWLTPLVPLVRLIGWLVFPFLLVTRVADSVAEIADDHAAGKPPPSPSEEIEALLDAGEEEGLIEKADRKLIQSVVEFGDKTVREVMTARPDVVAIDANASAEELRELMTAKEFSRVPVFDGSIDRVIGFLRSRDMLEIEDGKASEVRVREMMRPIALVPESKPIRDLLREMQDRSAHMAVVIDEYGQTAGLVTMEDLMEEIVGEIRDESEPEPDVIEEPGRSFVTSGTLDLDRLEELVSFRPDKEFESTTIGGLICEHLGQVPTAGTKMRLDGIQIEVLSADHRRVEKVRVRRLPRSERETD